MQMRRLTKQEILGMVAAFSANVIFGLSFMFSKKTIAITNPLVVNAVRQTIAFLVMSIMVLFGIFKVNYKGKRILKLLIMSIAQPICYFAFELFGMKYTSSAMSGLVIALVPIAVIIISSIFLREKPSLLQMICTVVSVSCVALVSILSNNGGKNHIFGILMLIGAVISAAVFNVIARSQACIFTPVERTYFMTFVGMIGFNIMAVSVMGKGFITELSTVCVNFDFWISMIYLSIVSSVGAFLLYNYSVTKISVIKTSSFANITTVVAILGGTIILKEDFSPLQFLLCIPIILGVWGVNLKKD